MAELVRNMSHDFLDTTFAAMWPSRSADPFIIPWPTRDSPARFLQFSEPSTWIAFIAERSLTSEIPHIVSAKIRGAQKLYALAWFDYDLIKVGELVALTALELALKDRYGGCLADTGKKPPTLHVLLRHMVEKDGFTDEVLPFVKRYGGSVLPYLYEADAAARRRGGLPALTTLAGIRNSLAHGDPFDGFPWSGLLELVRDLIHYAYRGYLAEVKGSAGFCAVVP
jgi:hypothetical protein